MEPRIACLQPTSPGLGVSREGSHSSWHYPTHMAAMVGWELGGSRSHPLPTGVRATAGESDTRALSPSSLPPEEGLRGESPLPRLAPHSAHGNEKHIGFIIPGLNEQGCHGDSHLRPARGQGRGW